MQTKFDKPIEVSHGKKFADMTRAQNIVFVAKVVASVATFGFAFPNVQNDQAVNKKIGVCPRFLSSTAGAASLHAHPAHARHAALVSGALVLVAALGDHRGGG